VVVSADAKGEVTVAQGRGALKVCNKGESGCYNEIAEYGFLRISRYNHRITEFAAALAAHCLRGNVTQRMNPSNSINHPTNITHPPLPSQTRKSEGPKQFFEIFTENPTKQDVLHDLPPHQTKKFGPSTHHTD
jgi:hypothetical protein